MFLDAQNVIKSLTRASFRIFFMKNILSLLFLVPALSLAQTGRCNSTVKKFTGDTGLGRPINMPKLKKEELGNFFETETKSMYDYTVNNDTIYRKLFIAYSKDSLPVIDFTKEILVFRVYCLQCMVTCQPNRLSYPCHRNACRYAIAWYIRNKKKNYGEN